MKVVIGVSCVCRMIECWGDQESCNRHGEDMGDCTKVEEFIKRMMGGGGGKIVVEEGLWVIMLGAGLGKSLSGGNVDRILSIR